MSQPEITKLRWRRLCRAYTGLLQMIHSISKRYIVQSNTRTNTIDIWNEP
jgi:hypothetical protein